MEDHLKSRPKKTIFSEVKVKKLRDQAIKKIKSKLLPDDGVLKILLIGSSIKGSFGEYESPGFRGSLHSDFDFIVFVKDDYEIPSWLQRELDGKPFAEDELNLAYRSRKFVEGIYDAEIFFVREHSLKDLKIVKDGESAGIPMTFQSKNKNLVIFEG
jgi:hypothetical protein